MVAGDWTPGPEEHEPEDVDRAPEEIAERIVEAGRLSELIDESEERKDELREEIYAAVDETVRAGNFQAVYTGPSTKEVLDMERAKTELDQADLDLAAFQFDELSVDVDDPAALARLLEELVEAGILEDEAEAGVSVSSSPTLEEERLRARLAELGVLEECTSEQTTRSGYVSIRRVEGGTE